MWRTANLPPRKTWPISVNTSPGSSPCSPAPNSKETKPSGTCSPKDRSSGITSTTSEMTEARSWTGTLSPSQRRSTPKEGTTPYWSRGTAQGGGVPSTRQQQLDRATNDLAELRQEARVPSYSLSPRSEGRGGGAGNPAEPRRRGLDHHRGWGTKPEENFKQDGPGRPNKHTRYVKENDHSLQARVSPQQRATRPGSV